jgi:hypothetical protein
MYSVLLSNASIAACGGQGVPVFETDKPGWFDAYQEAFATGPQNSHKKNSPILTLYGAGMGLKKSILEELNDSGFQPNFAGRSMNNLSSAEDTELTYAFVLMGYELTYAEHLKFQHFLPSERLQYSYVVKLFSAFGKDGPIRNLYHSLAGRQFLLRWLSNWHYHFALSVIRTVKYYIYPPKKQGRAVYYQWSKSYMKELLRIKESYSTVKDNILLLQTHVLSPHQMK